MATKLNQIVAVEAGVKAQATRNLTSAHRLSQQLAPLTGISRTYQPRTEDGEELPPESTRVQHTIEDINGEVRKTLERLFDVTATKDWANTKARADVEVDGDILLADVPVTYLLFLEKQLENLRTYTSKLPTLDPAQVWVPDDQPGVRRTEPVQTTRTKKVPKSFELSPATDKHPAQVTSFTEDVIVGDWSTIHRSGTVTEARRAGLVERVEKLQAAVKYAREHANTVEVEDISTGAAVLGYIFGD
jgi:hypothetical protein